MSQTVPTNPMPSGINLSYLEDIAGGSNEFIIEMIDMFLEQTPGYCQEIKLAIIDQDWKKVSDYAHKVKPTLAFMGSDSAKDAMASIEMDARNLVNLGSMEATFDSLHEQCLQLFADLKVARENLPGGN